MGMANPWLNFFGIVGSTVQARLRRQCCTRGACGNFAAQRGSSQHRPSISPRVTRSSFSPRLLRVLKNSLHILVDSLSLDCSPAINNGYPDSISPALKTGLSQHYLIRVEELLMTHKRICVQHFTDNSFGRSGQATLSSARTSVRAYFGCSS